MWNVTWDGASGTYDPRVGGTTDKPDGDGLGSRFNFCGRGRQGFVCNGRAREGSNLDLLCGEVSSRIEMRVG